MAFTKTFSHPHPNAIYIRFYRHLTVYYDACIFHNSHQHFYFLSLVSALYHHCLFTKAENLHASLIITITRANTHKSPHVASNGNKVIKYERMRFHFCASATKKRQAHVHRTTMTTTTTKKSINK